MTGATAAINIATPMVIGELVSVVQAFSGNGPFDINAMQEPVIKLLGLFLMQGIRLNLRMNMCDVLYLFVYLYLFQKVS